MNNGKTISFSGFLFYFCKLWQVSTHALRFSVTRLDISTELIIKYWVDAFSFFCLQTIYVLLSRKSEQERKLLSALVNKVSQHWAMTYLN